MSSLARAESSNSWDPTLLRIIPFIDGVASVARISQFADVDLNLTRKAVAHLVYYGCVILLDIFQFSAVYAPTADFGAFVESPDMQAECLRYVMVPWAQTKFSKKNDSGDNETGRGNMMGDITSQTSSIDGDIYGDNGNDKDISLGSSYHSTTTITSLRQSTTKPLSANPSTSLSVLASPSNAASAERMQYLLIRLYASLKQGLTLRSWCIENVASLDGVDIRRFITFGVIKGILYRVQKYAIAAGSVPAKSSLSSGGKRGGKRTAATAGERLTEALPTPSTSTNHNNKSRSGILSPPPPLPPSSSPPFPPVDLSNEAPAYSNLPNVNNNKTHTNSNQDPPIRSAPLPLPLPLARYLDGTHCFDQICTELEMAERDVLAKIKGWDGDVQLIYR